MNKKLAIAIFCITLGVNLLACSSRLIPAKYPDTDSYQQVADQISNHQSLYLEVRTPVYPLFLTVLTKFFRENSVIIIQALIAAVAAVVFWRLLVGIIESEKWSAFLTVLFMTEYGVAGWHGIILTESLSISLIIFWLYCQLIAWGLWGEHPLCKYFSILALFLDIALIMLKPAFVLLPLLWYLSLIFFAHFKTRPIRIKLVLVNMAIVTLVVVSYCGIMTKRYGHFEMTMIGRINHLGNILSLGQVKPDICEHRPCSDLQSRGVELAGIYTHDPSGPFGLTNELAKEFPQVKMSNMVDQLNSVLSPQPGLLELAFLKKTAYMFFEPIWLGAHWKTNWFNPNGFLIKFVWYRIYTLIIEVSTIILRPLAIIFSLYYLWSAFKKNQLSADFWVTYAFLLIVIYTGFVNVFEGYADYKRLMTPVVLEMNALVIFFLSKLIRKVPVFDKFKN